MAQLDDVHSDLRLNYETLRGLISLDSPNVAKPTGYETLEDHNLPGGQAALFPKSLICT